MPDSLASILAVLPPIVTEPEPLPTADGLVLLNLSLLAVTEPLTVDDYPFAC